MKPYEQNYHQKMNDTSYEQGYPQQNYDQAYNQPFVQPSNYVYTQQNLHPQQNAIYPQLGQNVNVVPTQFQNLPYTADKCDYPKQIICPYCNKVITTRVDSKIGSGTILWCVIVLILFWPLFWVPLVMKDCKDKVHKCSFCGHEVGIKHYKMC